MDAASPIKFETEQEKAARHKHALADALRSVVLVAEEARRDGFYVEFGLNLDQYGRYSILPPVGIVKRY